MTDDATEPEREPVPFQATRAGASYDAIGELPVTILLDNIRSLYNVGAFFRTADASRIAKLWLCGITGQPPNSGINKTALGAENTVRWEHSLETIPVLGALRESGYEIAAIETSVHAVDIFDWSPRFPVCVVLGNEKEGIPPEVANLCDTHVCIPMLGMKHSLNVATAGGIVMYELLRKYRALQPVR